MSEGKTIDVVIVSWNSSGQLCQCLAALASSRLDGFSFGRVVVVDNASTDGSVEGLECSELPLSVLRNRENRGFAAACNQGAQGTHADFLLFLNPDAGVFPDTLARSIEYLQQPENSRLGILGVQLVNEFGAVARTCARLPSLRIFLGKMLGLNRMLPAVFPNQFLGEWDHASSRQVDQVMGAYFLVRTAPFERLDGFDERFFLYFEEVDFTLRARKSGWLTGFLASAQCYHRGGGSSEQVKAFRLFYSLRSRLQYGFKHFNLLSGIVLLLATLFIEPFARLAQGAGRHSRIEIRDTRSAYTLLLADLPRIVAAHLLTHGPQ